MEKAIRFEKPSEVRTAVGKEVCVTDWVTVDQQRIDKFAEATGDFQWIHVDVERAKTSKLTSDERRAQNQSTHGERRLLARHDCTRPVLVVAGFHLR